MDIDKKLWSVIHIVGKTFSPKDSDTKSAFICFFDCLYDLLPNEDYRRVLRSFIQQAPLEKYISSSDSAFRWTYEFHSYVNLIKKRQGQLTNDVTYEQANKLYSNINKTVWGNSFWFILHYLSANLPENLTDQKRTSFIAFVMCIQFLIPCEECKFHMSQYINSVNIHNFMEDKKTVFQYTWQFHNAVSTRTKTKTMDFNEALNLYTIKNGVYTMID